MFSFLFLFFFFFSFFFFFFFVFFFFVFLRWLQSALWRAKSHHLFVACAGTIHSATKRCLVDPLEREREEKTIKLLI